MPPLITKKPCSFYKTNSCMKGTSCPYTHIDQPQEPTPRIVCKHYSAGVCSFGERCRNIHTKSGEDAPSEATKPEIPCVFWAKGSCTKGDRCHFFHGPLASDAASWKEQRPSPSASLNFGTSASPASHGATESDPASWREQRPSPSTLLNFGKSVIQATIFRNDHSVEQTSDRHSVGGFVNEDDGEDQTITKDEGQANKLTSPETIERKINRTRATFGAGAAVLKIQTAFESRRVTLSNMPDDISQKELIDLAETLGALESVVRTPPAPGIPGVGKAELIYLDMDSAKRAAAAFDGCELHSRRITAQLNLKSVDIDTVDLRSSTLKISWFAPTRTAYAHYPTIFLARKKASALDGKIFAGRKVSTVFQEPSRLQQSSFTVIVKGLPLRVQEYDLLNFCGALDVTISPANYNSKEGTASFRKRLEEFGPLESFDPSHPKMNDLKLKVLARFAKPEHASAAAKALHGQSHACLGDIKTWITLLHSIKYNIPLAQFRAVKDELHQMQQTNDHSAKIRIYDVGDTGRPVDPVCVRVYGDDPKALCRLKSNVEAIVSGEELKDNEGVSVWDEFFHGKESRRFLESVHKESGAFVRRDTRRKKIQVSGTPERRSVACELLLRKVLELRTQRRRISLTRAELGRLLQGGFARLEALLGSAKLTLDIRTRTLIVQGEEEDIEVAKLSLMTVESSVVIPESGNSGDCPVCFCDLTNPVQLACGHSYCFGCLRLFLVSAESFPVKCLAAGAGRQCDVPIPLATITQILLPADETKLFDTSFLAYIHQRPAEYHYCPTPDCELIYRPGEPGMVIRCTACLARICAHCHVENHEGLTCEQHRENTEGGEKAFTQWKQENNTSACPGCGVTIEKDGGCNHMTCIRCNTHMCWVCKQVFDPKEIYTHMNRAHGL